VPQQKRSKGFDAAAAAAISSTSIVTVYRFKVADIVDWLIS
jgi:hypothetical protein